MDRKKLLIFSATGIVIVLLALIGVTYGYYTTKISGNTNKNTIYVTSATLALEYSEDEDSSIDLSNIQPGVTSSKNFTITNVGNATVDSYGIYLEEVINTFSRTEDLQITLTCKEYNASGTFVKDCNGITMNYPTTNKLLVTNSIDAKYSHVYTFTFEYIYLDDVDQSEDIGKTLSGLIQVYNEPDVVTLTGTISGYSDGDYIEINSVPKISQISSKGTYTLTAMGLGEHTIYLKNSSGTTKASSKIKITKILDGESSINSDGNNIVINDNSKYAEINLKYLDESLTLEGVEIRDNEQSPFNVGTLAYNILINAMNGGGTRTIYKTSPLSTPAKEISGSSERNLLEIADDYTKTTGINSYYFRGNIEDNYVTFANMCWRIVRIEGDGSVKLILADGDEVCKSSTANKTKSGYIISYDEYSDGVASAVYLSNINTTLTNWYNKKNLTSYQTKYIKQDTWCEDSSYDFFGNCGNPGYSACTEETTTLKMICSGTTSTGYIGTLNANEAAFAGTIAYNKNNTYYLKDNAEYAFWYVKPYIIFDGNYPNSYYNVSGIQISGGGVNSVRPVITLKNTVEYKSGDGTITNAYQVK